jgi:hypothetical protein
MRLHHRTLSLLAASLLAAGSIAACARVGPLERCDGCPEGQQCDTTGTCVPLCDDELACGPCDDCLDEPCGPELPCEGGLLCIANACVGCEPGIDDAACAQAFGDPAYRCTSDGRCGAFKDPEPKQYVAPTSTHLGSGVTGSLGGARTFTLGPIDPAQGEVVVITLFARTSGYHDPSPPTAAGLDIEWTTAAHQSRDIFGGQHSAIFMGVASGQRGEVTITHHDQDHGWSTVLWSATQWTGLDAQNLLRHSAGSLGRAFSIYEPFDHTTAEGNLVIMVGGYISGNSSDLFPLPDDGKWTRRNQGISGASYVSAHRTAHTPGVGVTRPTTGELYWLVSAVELNVPATVPAPTIDLNAPYSVPPGGSGELQWTTTGAEQCTASGGWSGARSTAGSATISPTEDTRYQLTCEGPGGTREESIRIRVIDPAHPYPNEPKGMVPWFKHGWQTFPATFPSAASSTGYLHGAGNFGGFGNIELAADPDAPHGLGKSLRIRGPEGHPAGSSYFSWSHTSQPYDLGDARHVGLGEFYASFWVYFDPHPDDGRWETTTAWRLFSINRHVQPSYRAQLGLSVRASPAGYVRAFDSFWAWGPPTVSHSGGGLTLASGTPGPRVGEWAHVEVHLKRLGTEGGWAADGESELRVWLNGGTVIDSVITHAWEQPMRQFFINTNPSGSFHANSSTKTRDDYIRYSGVYVSGVPYPSP